MICLINFVHLFTTTIYRKICVADPEPVCDRILLFFSPSGSGSEKIFVVLKHSLFLDPKFCLNTCFVLKIYLMLGPGRKGIFLTIPNIFLFFFSFLRHFIKKYPHKSNKSELQLYYTSIRKKHIVILQLIKYLNCIKYIFFPPSIRAL